MKSRGKFKLTACILGLAGAALLTILVIHHGAAPVAAALRAAGWGIAAVAAFHIVPLLLDTLAWGALFPKAVRPRWRSLFWMRWIGESISTLIPSLQIGGDIVRTRLAALRGAPLPAAAATVLVDITLSIFTQVAFTLLGLGLLVHAVGWTDFARPILAGSVIGIIAVAGFYAVQRLGMFSFIGLLVSRIADSPAWHSLLQGGRTLDEAVRATYSRRRGTIGCCLWTFLSFIIGSGEIWIALHAMGTHATFANALILESARNAVRSAMFPVPGALGVQEGGYVIVGSFLGIPGETALALSLVERARELAVGIPALVVWQVFEGRRLLGGRGAAAR